MPFGVSVCFRISGVTPVFSDSVSTRLPSAGFFDASCFIGIASFPLNTPYQRLSIPRGCIATELCPSLLDFADEPKRGRDFRGTRSALEQQHTRTRCDFCSSGSDDGSIEMDLGVIHCVGHRCDDHRCSNFLIESKYISISRSVLNDLHAIGRFQRSAGRQQGQAGFGNKNIVQIRRRCHAVPWF